MNILVTGSAGYISDTVSTILASAWQWHQQRYKA